MSNFLVLLLTHLPIAVLLECDESTKSPFNVNDCSGKYVLDASTDLSVLSLAYLKLGVNKYITPSWFDVIPNVRFFTKYCIVDEPCVSIYHCPLPSISILQSSLFKSNSCAPCE